MTDIREIIRKIEGLKPVPQVAHKVLSLAEDPGSSASDLSEVIMYDQALTANILRVCNSALFSLPREIESVQQAIVYLGMSQIIEIVLMSGGSENMKGRQDGYDLEEGDLWRYSVSSALIARDLAERKGVENQHLIFTAALIKDIGKVILSQYVADSFEKINLLVSRHGFSFKEAEKKVIGIDHAELGGLVAEKWQFSPRMVEIIRNHHHPEEGSEYSLETSLVYMADMCCMMMGIGVGSDGLSYRFHEAVLERLGFSERDFQEIIAGFGEKIQQVESVFSMS